MTTKKILASFSMLLLLYASAVHADITHNIISDGDGSALEGWQTDPNYDYSDYGTSLRVGYANNSNAETTISNGEIMGIPYFVIGGNGSDARGEITITGTGTDVNLNNASYGLFLGHDGARSVGILNIEDDADVTVGTGVMYLGNHTLAAGETELDGAQGTINISGGTLTSQGMSYLGIQAGNTGIVNVEGGTAGHGIWNSTGLIRVGHSGNGSLNVGSEGEVSTTSISIGAATSGSGLAQIDGGTITVSSESLIGDYGTGIVDISNSGTLTSQGPFRMGNNVNSTGTLNVESGGAFISQNYVSIGSNPNSTGTLNVGSGGTWDAQSYFFVGHGGNGTLNVAEGGSVVAHHLCILGRSSTAEGLITINGGVLEAKSQIRIGQDGGTGIIEITNDGLLKASLSTDLNITMMDTDSKLRLSTGGTFAWIDGDGLTDNSASLGLTELATYFADDKLQYWSGDELTGEWSSLGLATLGTDYTLEYITDGGEFDGFHVLTVGGTTPRIPGDANEDGKVDGSDVTILAGNWQKGVGDGLTANWEEGDFNGDGKVDGSDVTILAGNWQYGVSAAAAAVPEPSTLVLLIALALAACAFKRR